MEKAIFGERPCGTIAQSIDWSKTVLGPVKQWPQSLRASLSIMMRSGFPMFVAWGPERIFFYNDAYAEILGKKHPEAFGRLFEDVWREIWDDIEPLILKVENLEAIYQENLKLWVNRAESEEEAYFTFSYSPIVSAEEEYEGLFCAVVETTKQLQAERTERTHREAAKNKFEWLQLILDKVAAAIFLVDPLTGEVIFANEAGRHMTGGVLPRKATDYGDEYLYIDEKGHALPLQDWPRFRAGRGEVLKGEKFTWKTPKGIWEYLVFGGPIPSSYGQADAALVCLLDITDLRRAERRLDQSEGEMRTLANLIPQLAWMADADGHVFWYNERWYAYTGTTLEQMQGWGWQSVHDPAILPTVMKAWTLAILSGDDFEMTFPLKGADGHFRWFLTRVQALRDQNGKIIRWFGTNTDIQEDRENAIALKLKSDALENSLNGFDIVNEDGAVIYVNQSYLRMWGYDSAEEVLGRSPAEHCADPDVPRQIITALKSQGQCDIEFLAKRKDGSTFDVRMLAFLTHDSEGREIYPTTSVDITDQRRSAEALTRAKEQAERANQLKSAFLANMSHEIRTPLGVMIGFADLICDPENLPEEREQYTETLKRNGEQLMNIVNDILDLSKVEAGYLAIEAQTFALKHVIDDVVAGLEVKAQHKHIGLTVEPSPALKLTITCDAMRLKQILFNLVGNAVKFTYSGQVTLRIVDDRDSFTIDVCDTGIGIAEEDQRKLFKPFSQADESMTRKFGGTGLGLALSKKLAELMGGELSIKESRLGVGSSFSLRLPKAIVSESDASVLDCRPLVVASAPPLDLSGRSILVVDDAPDNQLLISRFLSKQKAQVDLAENGQIAMQMALRGQYDIVIMDIQMPVMDGYTAAQKLRGLGYQQPIIALTAHALSDIRQRCLDVGYNDYASKPIDLLELQRKILDLLRGTPA